MRILVVGAGGVGGLFGAKLAAAGEDVSFIARGEHAAAIREHGLVVESIDGDFTTPSLPVFGLDHADAHPFDVVMLTVKSWDVASVVPRLKRWTDGQSLIIPLQNGIDAFDILNAHLSASKPCLGICYGCFHKAGPGLIKHTGVEPTILFGEADGSKSDRAERFRAAGQRAALRISVSSDPLATVWGKFAAMAPWSTVGALTRATIGEIRSCSESWELLMTALGEVVRVGRANGVNLPDDIALKKETFFREVPEDNVASMQRDLYDRCRFELEAQTGGVIRAAERVGEPVPFFRHAYAALVPQLRQFSARVA